MKIRPALVLTMIVVLFAACENDTYDTGDGSLSYMRADFGEMQTDASATMTSITTDDGERLNLTRFISAEWAERPDTSYRALLYYNRIANSDGTYSAQPISIRQVLVPQITDTAALKGGMKTDPVVFESSWKSRNGKYLNLGLYVKTGTVDGNYGTQTIGITNNGVQQNADGTRTIKLQLYHDQNGVPEYYSTETYVSIAVSRLPFRPTDGDTVKVSIATYDGTTTRNFLF